MDDQNKNLILATALSFLVILVWFLLFPPPQPTEQIAAPDASTDSALSPPGAPETLPLPDGQTAPAAEVETTLSTARRITIDTPRLTGSVSLLGGRIDDLKLTDYRVSTDPEAEIVTLLSPAGTADPYYAVHGWGGAGGLPPEAVPGALTEWDAPTGAVLSVGRPLELTWDNGAGLRFRKTITVDEDYMFTVAQSVENVGQTAARLFPYAILARTGEPDLVNFFVLHEGLVGAADGELTEVSYSGITDFEVDPREGGPVEKTTITETGWIGFTDHYWMATLVAPSGTPTQSVAKYTLVNDTYQTELRYGAVDVQPGARAEQTSYFFAGAKEWDAISRYQEALNIGQFVDAIDWGWFAFLTKPIFIALHYLNLWIGNMGWAILALTLVIKTLLFPLAWKSYVSMARMKDLQPEMEKIKERVGDDRQKLQQEMMQLYKDKKVNPAAG
ncbi:MAG: membrane protein insertase YidC, partial [Pseudomonadota bacterium]